MKNEAKDNVLNAIELELKQGVSATLEVINTHIVEKTYGEYCAGLGVKTNSMDKDIKRITGYKKDSRKGFIPKDENNTDNNDNNSVSKNNNTDNLKSENDNKEDSIIDNNKDSKNNKRKLNSKEILLKKKAIYGDVVDNLAEIDLDNAKVTSISMYVDVATKLDEFCNTYKMTKQEIISAAIMSYINKYED